MTNTKILLPFFILLTLLTIFSFNIPFFWDSTFFSALSVNFYDSGMNGFIAPLSFDTGGFPLYSAYLTVIWKTLGKTLLVSHLAMLPFLFGLVYEFFKLAKRYLNDRTIVLAIILLMLEPVFITQAMLMGYDIIIAYFFLLALNALYNNKNILFSIALMLLCLISIRGIMLATALFIIDLMHNRMFNFYFLRNYIPAFLILLLWTIYHKQQAGWYIFSPIREDSAEQFSGAEMMFRQFTYILWKNLDLGRVVLWIIFSFFVLYFLKKTKTPQHKELLRTIFVPFFVLTFFMILIKNPIGHKYFLVISTLLIISTCYFIQHIEKQKTRVLIFTLISICLFMGNFIVYPQRYGNAWDSSLKIIPFFKMEKEMNEYIIKNNISFTIVGTQFPLTNDLRYSQLRDPSCSYSDIENEPLSSFPYILYSNIINTNRITELDQMKKIWIVEKEFKNGMIELILYKNPNF